MKFTRLRVTGFKSFVDPAELRIDAGLTGVIGPNGCGKSNVLEALRWVMGATSAKSLRGGGMEDVIFSGTATRPARDRAEVILSIDNSDRRAPARFNDADILEVTRRITRGKGSDYKINGEEVRAKDVQLLFADAGTGANSPALVRQGQISELINAKPENRRRVLEEAAGVAGLRARRHEAQLRLNAAETNLDRLQEVVDTLQSRYEGLQKQARQAGRYRKLSADIRELEAVLWLRRWHEASEAAISAREHLAACEALVADAASLAASATSAAEAAANAVAPLREREAEASAALRLLERERDTLERDIDQARANIERLTARLEELAVNKAREAELSQEAAQSLERVRTSLKTLQDELAGDAEAQARAEAAMTDAETRRSQAEQKLDEASARLAEVKAAREAARRDADNARRRHETLRREADEAAARAAELPESDGPSLQELESAVSEAGIAAEKAAEAFAEAEEAAQTQTDAANTARDALRAAEAETQSLSREADSLRRLVASGDNDDGLVEQVRAKPGTEKALAAALGDDLEAGLSAEAARRWTGTSALPPALPSGVTALSEVIDAPSALKARLESIGLVDEADLDRLADLLKPGQRLVTMEGALRRWDGFAANAGAPSSAAIRLETRNRLETILAELEAARTREASARAEHDKAAQSASGSATALRAAREALDEAQRNVRETERVLSEGREAAVRAEARRANLTDTARRLDTEASGAKDALERAESALKAAMDADDGSVALEAARTLAERARAAAADARAALESARRDAQSRRHRIAGLEREEAEWSRRAQSAAERLTGINSAEAETRSALGDAEAVPARLEDRRSVIFDQLGEAESRARLARSEVEAAETALREADTTLRAAEREASSAREARAAAAATLEGTQTRITETAERLADATGETPQALQTRSGQSEYANLSSAELERRLDETRLSRERLGAVNLRADEEAEELTSERDRLTAERDDLVEAVARLRKAVDTLSREGRARLLAAFEVVDGHFRQLFSTLFGGGEAELRLTEHDDPLEAGLEIMACPPGKKMETMSLMSGGEQALTATALIFAVFLSNPAPVCVLDEVDAPLDDANVDRFCRMLEEMRELTDTRFLIITHNPVTMSRMDRLFGVTMGEQGVSQLVSVNLRAAEALLAAE
ncbi:chromosome segregation protein SMC [Glycocaulis sp.]|uniref:chromosome segregation protein SMC n=1 Tax=Glycocaulis sp. TaxID=1969725 RepID=UPI003D19E5A8